MRSIFSNIAILTALCLTLTSCDKNKDEPAPPSPIVVPENEKMILFLFTEAGGETLQLPIARTDCTIDWGDGSEENSTADYPAHTYAQAGGYTVTISGRVAALTSGSLTEAERSRILAVMQWGKTGLTDVHSAFEGCTELRYIPDDKQGAFYGLIHFSKMFAGCTNLRELPAGLFDWAGTMFNGNFNSTFAGCTSLREIPADLFNQGGAYFSNTFQGCTALSAIPIDLFEHSPEADGFDFTFQGCTGLTAIPASLFDACPKIRGLIGTFLGCTSLTGESPYTLVDGVKVHLYERNGTLGGLRAPERAFLCFQQCTGLSDYAAMPAPWN